MNLLVLLNLIVVIYADIPLGCIENENLINLNWPFFTIPAGKRVYYEESCNGESSGIAKYLSDLKTIGKDIRIEKKKDGILAEKKKSLISKFYSTEDLSPYSGLLFGKHFLKGENHIFLKFKKIEGNGLFLLVIKNEDRFFARQMIIEEIKCPIIVKLYMDELFEVPYRKSGFKNDMYEISLYFLNYNEMKWIIMDFQIK